MPTAQRLEEFHAVENTYLSTFKTLGGLGCWSEPSGLPRCCCATCWNGVASWRFSAPSASGAGTFLPSSVRTGAAAGLGTRDWRGVRDRGRAAGDAEHGGRLPAAGAALLVVAVFAAGLLSSAMATRRRCETPLLEALRSE
jgi:hypothetical protein